MSINIPVGRLYAQWYHDITYEEFCLNSLQAYEKREGVKPTIIQIHESKEFESDEVTVTKTSNCLEYDVLISHCYTPQRKKVELGLLP